MYRVHLNVTPTTFLNPPTSTITVNSTTTVFETTPTISATSTVNVTITTSINATVTQLMRATSTSYITYTVSSTSTAYAACQTDNFWGPLALHENHIINIYNSGMGGYTNYDLGYSHTAQDCCIECHASITNTTYADVESGNNANTPSTTNLCTGSVFSDGKCYLLKDAVNQCNWPGASAAVFLSRPGGEKPPKRQRWPDFVLSNGPCGYLYDGGLGI